MNKQQKTETAKAELNANHLYTLTELEPILGVTHRTLLSWIKDGKLKGTRAGGAGKWRVSKATLDAFTGNTDAK